MSDYLVGAFAAFLLAAVVAAFAITPLAGFTAVAFVVVGAVISRMLRAA
jgi:hypothetical protein